MAEKAIYGHSFLVGTPRYEGGRLYLYLLLDPRDEWVRYVGVTQSPAQRKWFHMMESHNPGIRAWCAELQAFGLEPILQVVGRPTYQNWAEAERRWIRHLRRYGPCLNRDKGGEADAWWAKLKPGKIKPVVIASPPHPSRKKRNRCRGRTKKKRGIIDSFGIYRRDQPAYH